VPSPDVTAGLAAAARAALVGNGVVAAEVGAATKILQHRPARSKFAAPTATLARHTCRHACASIHTSMTLRRSVIDAQCRVKNAPLPEIFTPSKQMFDDSHITVRASAARRR
jgi:hypothetical protein